MKEINLLKGKEILLKIENAMNLCKQPLFFLKKKII